jgi:predicted nucleic acid-binding protein
MITFFADANFLVSLLKPSDERHHEAKSMFKHLSKQHNIILEDLFLSSLVMVEVFHLLHDRDQSRNSFETARSFFNTSIKNDRVYHLKQSEIEEAFTTILMQFHKQISLVDATSVFLVGKHKIDYLLTFDGGFVNIPIVADITDIQMLKKIVG